ncbi:hypothetical protein HYT45_00420 [Candidatus Uhrbacteria bacterium]|nr:hypothetical protein [Candidatus Uhrbacteria bacterium]
MPLHPINFLQKHFFAHHLARELKELYASTAILTFAAAAIAIFEPIYFITIGFTLAQVLLFYGTVYVLYFFLLPLGAKFARSRGYEHGILYSSPFLILYYLSLFAIPQSKIFVGVAVLAFAIQKILYWPSFHADMARFGNTEERGRELGGIELLLAFVAILAPAFGGLIISLFGFKVLFAIVSVLILASNIPLLLTPENFTPVPFSYKDAMADLFKKENARKTISRFGFGEQLLTAIAWPIFIFAIVPQFRKLGLIVSATILFTSLTMLIVGRLTDTRYRNLLIRLGTIFTFFSHPVRLMVLTPFGVLAADTFYGISRSVLGIPFTASVYDEAKNGSIMRSLMRHEMALAAGKALASFAGIALIFLFPPGWAALFIFGAFLTLFYFL